MEDISAVFIHQMLHMLEIGAILVAVGLASIAIKRPKYTIEEIVRKLNDLQLKR